MGYFPIGLSLVIPLNKSGLPISPDCILFFRIDKGRVKSSHKTNHTMHPMLLYDTNHFIGLFQSSGYRFFDKNMFSAFCGALDHFGMGPCRSSNNNSIYARIIKNLGRICRPFGYMQFAGDLFGSAFERIRHMCQLNIIV